MKITNQRVARFAISYLVAAAIQTAFMVIAMPTPHPGMGPIFFGAFLLFWILPVVSIYFMATAGFTSALLLSFAIFLITFMVILFGPWGEVRLKKPLKDNDSNEIEKNSTE